MGRSSVSSGYKALMDVHLMDICLNQLVQQSRNGCGSLGGVAWQRCWVESL